MSAHTPARDQGQDRIEIQLPWWSVALPAVAFGALLLLLLNPAEAHAAGGTTALTQLLERLQEAFASRGA
ncbi:hypothetical protein ABZ929_28055 [Streptomyces physcomitrii]|uniref:hypothetical protein n=1 Tax=Streptomyces physcomitrii TaxID=2724184 RepID=UPI003443383F